jgi:hypothetical protein
MMTTNTPQPRQTAKIYAFPVGGRASVGPRHAGGKPQASRPAIDLKVTPTEAGSGWYHDAAIQDAKRTWDH